MTCEGSVPQAITAFLESEGYEDAIRKAISIGGDSDTIACMAGGIAEAFYGGVPHDIADFALGKLDDALREVIVVFEQTYSINR
jgi:ADP-ribosylglycohydrolase